MSAYQVGDIAPLLTFGAYCAAMSVAVLVLDLFTSLISGTSSLLGIKYTKNNWLAIAAMWSAGAAIMGCVGLYMEVFQANKNTVFAIAAAWPLILTRVVGKARAQQSSGEDEEAAEVEAKA
jgi:hypothetical protein